MSASFSLVDTFAVSDLQVYLSRAERVEGGSVRLIADSGVLAVYTAILYPRGLMDRVPTVLGLRTFATDTNVVFDAVVPMRSLRDRLDRVVQVPSIENEPLRIRLPLEVSTVTWAGISPPRGGWTKVGESSSEVLHDAAEAGIRTITETIPEGTGEQLVQQVRAEVWGQPITGLEYVPAGASFATSRLGFLGQDTPIPIYETGPWTRLTTKRGHVLVRRPPWTLKP